MYSNEVVENVFGFVFPYGSFALNMCSWDSDMDLYVTEIHVNVECVLFQAKLQVKITFQRSISFSPLKTEFKT